MKFAKLTFVAFIAAAAVAVQAEPLPRNQISADANWFVHADVDQLKQTQIGKFVLQQLSQPEAKQKVDAFTLVLGFDPTIALHGVTLYGQGNKPEGAVLLVNADFDPERLTTLAKGGKEYSSTQHGKYTVHSWIDDNKKQRSYGAIVGKTVVLGQKAAAVDDVLDVIDGTKPSLKGSNAFDKIGIEENSAFLVGSARQNSFFEQNPAAAMLKDVNALSLAALEKNQQFQAQLRVVANTEETARRLLSINQGVIAWLSMQNQKPDSMKLAQALSVVQSSNTLNISFKLPIADSIQLIKDAEAKKKK